jgi:hypothetical protein
MCRMLLDVFVSNKLQNRLEAVLLKLCFNDGRSENEYKVCNFNTSFNVYLWSNTANKVHKFRGHEFIDYLTLILLTWKIR